MHPKIEMVPQTTISRYQNNARSRSPKQLPGLTASIENYGFNSPIVIDENNEIINGHGRFEALTALGWEMIPCIRVLGLSDAQKQAYRIADNEIGAMSRFVNETLEVELNLISQAGLKLESATALSTPKIDFVLGQAREARGPDIDADAPLPLVDSVVSRFGDLWRLGDHRLLCGDARDLAILVRILDGELVRMVFADGPYNLPIKWLCRRGRSTRGIRYGFRREIARRVHGAQQRLDGQCGGGLRRRRRFLCLHGLASHARGACGR